MILDQLERSDLYEGLNSGFAAAFKFLQRSDLRDLPPGRHEIDGERVYATISRQDGRRREEAKLEMHRKYIDLHYLIAGGEEMGWRSALTCFDSEDAFNDERDFQLFCDAPSTWFTVNPEQFVIFYPADAHIPLVGPGELHKAVIKVAASNEI